MKKLVKSVRFALCCLVAVMFAVVLTAGLSSTTTAQAEAASTESGTSVVLDYTVNKDNTLTVTLSIKGEVCFAGFVGELQYDSSVLTYSSSEELISGIYLNNASAGSFAFSYASAKDVTSDVDMFSVTFSYTGTFSTSVNLVIGEGDFSNASFEDVTYTVVGGTIVVDGTENIPTTDSSTEESSASNSSESDSSNNTEEANNNSAATMACGSITGGGSFSTGLMIVSAGAIIFIIRKLRLNSLKR